MLRVVFFVSQLGDDDDTPTPSVGRAGGGVSRFPLNSVVSKCVDALRNRFVVVTKARPRAHPERVGVGRDLDARPFIEKSIRQAAEGRRRTGRQAGKTNTRTHPQKRGGRAPLNQPASQPAAPRQRRAENFFLHRGHSGGHSRDSQRGVCCNSVCAMILPQVHLRKPCYDFSFL